MSELITVVVVVCASGLVCTLVSSFISNGSTKKIVNLILGAFIICSMIVPVKNAVSQFKVDFSDSAQQEEYSATNDEAYSNQIITTTKENLEKALKDLLLQNDIEIKNSKIILSVTDENSIIISSISIYINKEYTPYSDFISSLTLQNFGVTPSIFTE